MRGRYTRRNKKRMWCPIEKDYYMAEDRKIICSLCKCYINDEHREYTESNNKLADKETYEGKRPRETKTVERVRYVPTRKLHRR